MMRSIKLSKRIRFDSLMLSAYFPTTLQLSYCSTRTPKSSGGFFIGRPNRIPQITQTSTCENL